MATGQQQIFRLGRADHGRPLTAAEFAEAVFDEPWRYERVAGRLVVMAPPGGGHQQASFPWENRLHVYCSSNPKIIGYVLGQPWVVIDGKNDRVGDFGVYLATDDETLEIPGRVPEIMFEVVSPGRASHERDYVEKRGDYYRVGIREYVIIDRFRRTVTIFTSGPDGYSERVLVGGSAYTSPLLPGLIIPLSEVFRP